VRPTLDQAALDLLFLEARTQNGWLPTRSATRRAPHLRHREDGAHEREFLPGALRVSADAGGEGPVLPALSPGNVDKTKQAPVTAIIGYDTRFFEWMPTKLFAHRPDMAENYAKKPALAEITAFRNGTLQGAYFMLARAPSGWTSAACRGSTTRRSTPSSFRTGA